MLHRCAVPLSLLEVLLADRQPPTADRQPPPTVPRPSTPPSGLRSQPFPSLIPASLMDSMISQLLAANQKRINALCSELVVRELRIFGSAVSGTFNISTSDVDVVVDFFDSDAPGIADRFMALALGLERIFQRPVDLVTRQGMKNPIFRATVEQTSQPLYAA